LLLSDWHAITHRLGATANPATIYDDYDIRVISNRVENNHQTDIKYYFVAAAKKIIGKPKETWELGC